MLTNTYPLNANYNVYSQDSGWSDSHSSSGIISQLDDEIPYLCLVKYILLMLLKLIHLLDVQSNIHSHTQSIKGFSYSLNPPSHTPLPITTTLSPPLSHPPPLPSLSTYRRYRILDGRPIHASIRSIVFRCEDLETFDGDGKPIVVAVKLLRRKGSFKRELVSRDAAFR